MLGKQVLLKDACLRLRGHGDDRKLRVHVSKFKVLATCWDTKTFFPKVRAIEDDNIVKALIQLKLLQIQRRRLVSNVFDDQEDSTALMSFGSHSMRGERLPLEKGASKAVSIGL